MEYQSSSSGTMVDLNAICRLCLSHQPDTLKSIYEVILMKNLVHQKIELLLQVKISRHDKLSHMVCNECIDRLDSWFIYKKQCHKNQLKLTEWLKISQSDEDDPQPEFQFNPSDYDPSTEGLDLLPVKVEITDDGDEYGDVNVLNGLQPVDDPNDHIFLQDLDFDLSNVETDDDRRCPDCGRMFGSAQNRRRHQNMLHAKKERRAKMTEIRKQKKKDDVTRNQFSASENKSADNESADNLTKVTDDSSAPPEKTVENNEDNNIETKLTEITSTSDSERKDEPNVGETVTVEDKNSSEKDEVNEAVSKDTLEDMEIDDALSSDKDEDIDKGSLSEDDSACETPTFKEKQDNNELKSKKPVAENNPEGNEKKNDEKKIKFAAGLELVQKDTNKPAGTDKPCHLSKIELSYVEKCRAMVSMYQTLQCACHNVQHKQQKHLLQHLRDTRLWFPLYTCLNCMISLTDRSSSTRHIKWHCSREPLEALKKLANLRERTAIKARLYQNFKCNRCQFLFSFHDDICKHIDEDHVYGSAPFYCSCRCIFDTLEDYKTHAEGSLTKNILYTCSAVFQNMWTLRDTAEQCKAL